MLILVADLGVEVGNGTMETTEAFKLFETSNFCFILTGQPMIENQEWLSVVMARVLGDLRVISLPALFVNSWSV